MDRNYFVQVRNNLRNFLKTAANVRLTQNAGNFFSSWRSKNYNLIIIVIIIKIRDNKKGTCTLICVAISGDRNVIKKKSEKIIKCKIFTREIQHMWNVKINVMPVLLEATGTISKTLRNYLSNIADKHANKKLQETAILGAHALESTNVKVQ